MDPARPAEIVKSVENAGFAVISSLLSPHDVQELVRTLEALDETMSANDRGPVYAIRNLLDLVPEIRALSKSPKICTLVGPIVGPSGFPVRGILFDKVPQANWIVPWHQDLTIAVHQKKPAPGFGPWSVKAGVVHVQPPIEILAKMLAVRIHLDDCGPLNGPLRVIPGSHRLGRLTSDQLQEISKQPRETCTVPEGGVMLMRPLLVHASSSAKMAGHRRVLHIEYASAGLPHGLEWAIASR